MKLATFELNGKIQVGVVDEDKKSLKVVEGVASVLDIIKGKSKAAASGQEISLSQVKLLAPIPAPERNVFCVGKNYHAHAKEFANSGFEAGAVKGAEIDEFPAVFTKTASSVIGPGADVSLHPQATKSVDYEVELALVIGKGGRDIPKEKAYDHIFGYTIINDVTARDRQKNHKQWFLGKTLDTFCPMGPWITTSDELDPENLDVKCWVNDELRQNANTSDLIFDIPTIVSTISAGLTLVPGDIIATGTPAGVGIGFNPPKFLKAGDVVKLSISGIGTLTNTFR